MKPPFQCYRTDISRREPSRWSDAIKSNALLWFLIVSLVGVVGAIGHILWSLL